MLDHDDLKWVATQLTELNRQLQQVSRHSERARAERENDQLQLLDEQVEQAARISQALFDRVTSRILSSTAHGGKLAHKAPRITVLPPPQSGPFPPTVAKKIPVGEVAIESVPNDEPVILNPHGKRELILMVDDDPDVRERAGAILEDEDYRVVLAKDALEALQIYGRMGSEISLVILDFFLPVMDGDAVFDELKAIDPQVQVVLSSGFAEQTKLGSMLARGLCGFIPKPYTSDKLLDQVRSIIAA